MTRPRRRKGVDRAGAGSEQEPRPTEPPSTEGEASIPAPEKSVPRQPPSHSRAGYFFFIVALIGVAGVALLLFGRTRSTLLVRAFPREATITVDGELRGQGEAEIRFLKPGWHLVEAAVGTLSRGERVLLEPGEKVTTTVELRRGFLVARSSSGHAVVTVEGTEEPLGLTPVGPTPLWAGTTVLRFSLAGHAEQTETVAVAARETTVVDVTLMRGRGVLAVEVLPESAAVFVGEKLAGRGPRVAHEVPTGSYRLAVRAAGWSDAVKDVEVEQGDTVRWSVHLEQIPTGWLSVQSVPSRATVTQSGGRALGATPLDRLALRTGTYKLRIEKAGYIPKRIQVDIQVGRHVTRDVRLDEEFRIRRVAVNSRPTATVLLDGRMVGETPMTIAEVPTGEKHVLTLLTSDGRTWTSEFVLSPQEREAHLVSHDFMREGETGQ
jgi:hypothetical protein